MVSKKGMEPSSLLSSCKFYGRVNTVNVLEEVLFIDFLVDDKASSTNLCQNLGGGMQCLGLFALSTPYRG